jgi:hypothetical protein
MALPHLSHFIDGCVGCERQANLLRLRTGKQQQQQAADAVSYL